jgi:hypothetical protein
MNEVEADIQNRSAFEKAVNTAVPCPLCDGACEHSIMERFPWTELDRMFAIWNAALATKPDIRPDENRFPCCEKKRPMLICSGHSSDGRRENIFICESCGQFDVRLIQGDLVLSTRFSLWSDRALDAAVKPFNRAADEDGDPHYSTRGGSNG